MLCQRAIESVGFVRSQIQALYWHTTRQSSVDAPPGCADRGMPVLSSTTTKIGGEAPSATNTGGFILKRNSVSVWWWWWFTYYTKRSTPCPNVKLNDEWGDFVNCEQGDSCCYCHTRTEQQFHPEVCLPFSDVLWLWPVLFTLNIWLTVLANAFCCTYYRSTSQPSVMMSNKQGIARGAPSVLLPTMKVRCSGVILLPTCCLNQHLPPCMLWWIEELTAPRELTDAPMASTPSPVVLMVSRVDVSQQFTN